MNKKYIAPEINVYDFVEEGMIAASTVVDMDSSVEVDQLTEEKGMWDEESGWDTSWE